MEVRQGQHLGLALGEPVLCRRALALRAMPVAAAVVRDLGVRALLAARDMAAERRGAAALDRRHHLQLVEADVPGIGAPPCRPMAAEDIRDLQYRTGHRRRPLRRRLLGLLARLREQVERALDGRDHAGGDAGVARRGVELLVTQQPRGIMRSFYVIET